MFILVSAFSTITGRPETDSVLKNRNCSQNFEWYDEPMKKVASMIIHSYPAIFRPAKEGGYDVSFPDFPGCVTFGKSFENAQKNAKEALQLWLEELSEHGQEIPTHKAHPIVDEISITIPVRAHQ